MALFAVAMRCTVRVLLSRFVQLFEKYGTLIERYKALIEKVSSFRVLVRASQCHYCAGSVLVDGERDD
eukprot:SAG31_NODE_1646_length_7649_cov_3.317616_8_plen_68_part_00